MYNHTHIGYGYIKLIFNREYVRLSQIMNITTPGVMEYLSFATGTLCLAISQLAASLPNEAHFAIAVMICFFLAEVLRPRKKTSAALRKTLVKLQKKNKFLRDEKEKLRMKIRKYERFGCLLERDETPDELFTKLMEKLNTYQLNDFLISYGEKFIKEALYKYLEEEGETQQNIIGKDLALYKSYKANDKRNHRGYAVGYYLSRLQEEGRVVRKKVGNPVFWSIA